MYGVGWQMLDLELESLTVRGPTETTSTERRRWKRRNEREEETERASTISVPARGEEGQAQKKPSDVHYTPSNPGWLLSYKILCD